MVDRLRLKRTRHEQQQQEHHVLEQHLFVYDDILSEILLRLPINSLSRFKCVCNSWLSLISNSHFTQKHLRRILTTGGINTNSSRLLVLKGSSGSTQSIDYEKFKDGVRFESLVKEHTHDFKSMLELMEISGSCNGLICLQITYQGNYGQVILWNPSTAYTKNLPSPEEFIGEGSRFYGFGYDSKAEDYKVIMGVNSSNYKGNTTKILVLALETDSWRSVEDLEFVDLKGRGCLLNGALHWLVRRSTGSTIMAFDLAEDKFRSLSHIDHKIDPSFEQGIETISNFLCFYTVMKDCQIGDTAISISVMMQYGVEKSWTKLVQISAEVLPRNVSVSKPIAILPNGEVLISLVPRPNHNWMRREGSLALCNIQENKCQIVTDTLVGWFVARNHYVQF